MKALVYLPLLAAALLLGWQLSRSTPPAPAPTQAELAPEPATQTPPVSLLRESAPTLPAHRRPTRCAAPKWMADCKSTPMATC
ncbi:hypothetical protein ULF88_11995 [Halopseudomonas pachastrellae]|nr:hypothetical protein [Halopseudomonas pachastrellae]